MENSYINAITNRDINKSNENENNISMNIESVENDIVYGNKKVHITLEFPYTVSPKEAKLFERNLRQIYLNKMLTKTGQIAYHALPSKPLKGKVEQSLQGGISHE